ncbi:MAG: phosphatidylglycerophosphatase A [Alphaproteobacteria bacterium]|nr:phosphatidylglycerophosphatase A [Alphaproteobacteria bacterium]
MNVSRAIATLFGIGHAGFAPGTVASIVSLPLAYLIAWSGGRFALLLAAIIALAIGAWASELYARQVKSFDPKECVVDELAGQWIACAFAPVALLAYAFAFALFRLFDIWKPWPIRKIEHLHGGIGIMADDLVAAVFAGVVLAVLAHLNLI